MGPRSGRAVESRSPSRVEDSDDIDELATEFGVSSLVIEHQIKNHRIARVW